MIEETLEFTWINGKGMFCRMKISHKYREAFKTMCYLWKVLGVASSDRVHMRMWEADKETPLNIMVTTKKGNTGNNR